MAIKLPSTFFLSVMFAVLVCLASSATPVLSDPDTAWHLANGDLIRSHGIPLHDSWSFTATQEPWYNLSWLFDLGISYVYSFGGLPALYTLTLTVFAGSMAFMADYCLKRGARPVAIGLIAIPTLSILLVGVLARPNMCSIGFTIAFYCLLYRYRASGKMRDLLPLPFIMAVWVNLHGGFLLAFLLIALFWLDAIIDTQEKPNFASTSFIARKVRDILCNAKAQGYAIIFIFCLAATLLNPYGFGIYYGAYKTLFAWFDHKYVMEWKPIEIGKNMPFTVWFVLVLALGSFTDKRAALIDRLLAVALIMLSLSSVRHSIISTLLLMPYLTLRLTTLLDASVLDDTITLPEKRFLANLQKPAARMGALLVVVFAVMMLYKPWLREEVLHKPLRFPANRYPVVEAAYILTHYPTLHFLNHYDIGGYLIYIWRGKQKVFVDGRASSLYSDELLHDYAEFMDSAGFSQRSEAIVRYYHIDGLIMPNDARNAANIQWNPAWKLVYRGPVAAVYLKASIAPKIAPR